VSKEINKINCKRIARSAARSWRQEKTNTK